MLEALREFLSRIENLKIDDRIVVGYSGGPDSTCLVHLLHRAGFDIVAAHLHHGQRVEADDELQNCQKFCEASNIAFVSGRADVPLISQTFKIGVEEAGRRARYEFLEQTRIQTESHWIATAHTSDDNIETVLLHLARGTGLSGIAGIPPVRDTIIRPILGISRSETQSYCREHKLWTHDDPSNSDLSLARARVRARIVPELESLNPRVRDAISRLSATVREEDRYLDSVSAAMLERCETHLNGAFAFLTQDCEVAFDSQAMRSYPVVLVRRGIRLAARALGAELDWAQVSQIGDLINHANPGSVTAEGGEVVVELQENVLRFRQLNPHHPYRYPLTVPGETESLEFGWSFRAWNTSEIPDHQNRSSLRVWIDPKSLKGALYFRPAEPADVIQPYGFEGSRKVSDLLSEAKLTLAARKRIPILYDMVGPVWLPGICLSNRVKCAKDCRSALCVEFGPVATPSETTSAAEA